MNELTKVWAAAAEFADGAQLRIAELESENLAILAAKRRLEPEIMDRAAAADAARAQADAQTEEYHRRRAEVDADNAAQRLSASVARRAALNGLIDQNNFAISEIHQQLARQASIREERERIINGPTKEPRVRSYPKQLAGATPLDISNIPMRPFGGQRE